jgi:hypothetical protein
MWRWQIGLMLIALFSASLAFAQVTTGPGPRNFTVDAPPTASDSCRLHDTWVDTSAIPRQWYVAVDCTAGASVWNQAGGSSGEIGSSGIAFADLPASPSHGDTYFVLDLDDADHCDAGGGDGTFAADCWWDGEAGAWIRKTPGSQQGVYAIPNPDGFRGWNAVPCTDPEVYQPERDTLGEEAPRLIRCGDAGTIYTFAQYGPPGAPLPFQAGNIYIPIGAPFQVSHENSLGDEVVDVLCDNPAGSLTGCSFLTAGVDLTAHIADTADAHDASAISNVPAGNIAATNQQAVNAELDAEKMPTFTRIWAFSETVIDAAGSMDNVMMNFIAPVAMTVTGVACKVLSGTVVLAPTFTLEDDDGNAMTITGTNPTCAAVGTDATWAAVTAGNSLVEGEGLRYDITNSPDGNDTFSISVKGTVP